MFDMGFAELLLIGVVGLLVIGPERLPGTIRMGMAWMNRLRRSFDDVKAEVQRELHNDEVMQQLRDSADNVRQELETTRASVEQEAKTLGQAVEIQHDALSESTRDNAS